MTRWQFIQDFFDFGGIFVVISSGIVREMAHKSDSKLKSISTTRLDPQHHLW